MVSVNTLFKKPEVFDVLGLATFIFIIIISSYSLITKIPLPNWSLIILLIIGILGLIIDGMIVYTSFIK
jgi:uncharacterized membrane protein